MEDFMDSELSLDNISFLDDDELSNTFNMDSEEKESNEKNEQTKEIKTIAELTLQTKTHE